MKVLDFVQGGGRFSPINERPAAPSGESEVSSDPTTESYTPQQRIQICKGLGIWLEFAIASYMKLDGLASDCSLVRTKDSDGEAKRP